MGIAPELLSSLSSDQSEKLAVMTTETKDLKNTELIIVASGASRTFSHRLVSLHA